MNIPATGSGLKRGSFNWRQAPSRLPRQLINQQGLVTHLAYTMLGGRDPAVAFLNLHNVGLGGKPLDLAGESSIGYAAVCGEVRRLASILAGDQR